MKRLYQAILLTLPLALGACGKSTLDTQSPGAVQPASQSKSAQASTAQTLQTSEIPASQTPNIEAARKFARGFDAGNLMSSRLVYVFFDPQCPHCGQFWKETKSLEKDVHFIWVPVSVLNGESLKQGAAILSAAKPADTMTEHEDKLAAHTGGLQAGEASPQLKAVLLQNTRLLASFGATGVPFVLGVNQQTGQTYSNSGGMPSAELAKKLGWASVQSPAAASAPTSAKASVPSPVAFEMRNAGAPVAIHLPANK